MSQIPTYNSIRIAITPAMAFWLYDAHQDTTNPALRELLDAINAAEASLSDPLANAYRALAQAEFGGQGDKFSFDDHPEVSQSEEGAQVALWTWVNKEDAEHQLADAKALPPLTPEAGEKPNTDSGRIMQWQDLETLPEGWRVSLYLVPDPEENITSYHDTDQETLVATVLLYRVGDTPKIERYENYVLAQWNDKELAQQAADYIDRESRRRL